MRTNNTIQEEIIINKLIVGVYISDHWDNIFVCGIYCLVVFRRRRKYGDGITGFPDISYGNPFDNLTRRQKNASQMSQYTRMSESEDTPHTRLFITNTPNQSVIKENETLTELFRGGKSIKRYQLDPSQEYVPRSRQSTNSESEYMQ